MSLTIELSPALESRVQSEAQRAGVSVDELVNRVLGERFHLKNGSSTPETLASWNADEAPMSAQELEAERRIFEQFEQNVNETRHALGMRTL